MYRIRRLAVIQTANVVALMYLVLVAIFAIPFGLLMAAAGQGPGGFPAGVAGGIGFAIGVPLAYAAVGWIFTALATLLYNLVARWIGGIQIQLELEPMAATSQPPIGSSAPSGAPAAPAGRPTRRAGAAGRLAASGSCRIPARWALTPKAQRNGPQRPPGEHLATRRGSTADSARQASIWRPGASLARVPSGAASTERNPMQFSLSFPVPRPGAAHDEVPA